jgi:hypothetical protein
MHIVSLVCCLLLREFVTFARVDGSGSLGIEAGVKEDLRIFQIRWEANGLSWKTAESSMAFSFLNVVA